MAIVLNSLQTLVSTFGPARDGLGCVIIAIGTWSILNLSKYLADGQVFVSRDLVSRDSLSADWVTGTCSYCNCITFSSP